MKSMDVTDCWRPWEILEPCAIAVTTCSICFCCSREHCCRRYLSSTMIAPPFVLNSFSNEKLNSVLWKILL